jgi:hypothetical protein
MKAAKPKCDRPCYGRCRTLIDGICRRAKRPCNLSGIYDRCYSKRHICWDFPVLNSY